MKTFDTPRQVVSSDGCRLTVWEAGNPAGPPVVFLHGFSLDHTVWSRVAESEQLRQRCRLVFPDLRGHGSSEHPSESKSYTSGRLWSDDLLAIIKTLGLERPLIVAWSYGGRMVNDYVRHYGSDGLLGINFVAAATLAEAAAIGPLHGCLAELCSSDPDIEEAAASQYVREVFKASEGSAVHQQLVDTISRTMPLHRTWLRQRALDYDALLAKLSCPALVSHGAQDQVVLPLLASRLFEVIPTAQVSIYLDAGHAPFYEEPHRFCFELLQFIDRCSSD
jgi:pimeloyl-ACP methyl ester carboxylesterase